MSARLLKFSLDILPSDEGGKMKTWFVDDPFTGVRTYYVDRAYRKGDGTPDHFRRHTTDPIVHAQQIVEAQAVTGESSLTSMRFSECVKTYLNERGEGGFNSICYNRAIESLGRLYPDRANFATEYSRYVAKLNAMHMAINTANNHKIIVRTVCNFGYKTGRCGIPTVRDWALKSGNERNRILSTSEELSIINKMIEKKSHILEAVKFSLINPIRKRDLFSLRRDALKMEPHNGEIVWLVKFQARKTRRKVKETTLPNVNVDFVRYVQSLPFDCPWMFPKLSKKGWKKVVDADRHFNYIIDKAGINDFHWHDLKHCAETYMLRQGYTYDMLRKLGIQTSPKTQAIYDNRSQVEIVASVSGRRSSVGLSEQKVA